MCGDGGAGERRRARKREEKARAQYEKDMRAAEQEAAAEAERNFQANLKIQQQQQARMTQLVESVKPKSITYGPTQVRSSYDDSGMGVRSAQSKRKKSNLGNLRIKLNPSLNIASQGGGSSTNLG